MPSDQSAETIAALTQWRNELDKYCQPWPEWDALVSLVNDADFSLNDAPHVPFTACFLVSAPDADGNSFSRLIMEDWQTDELISHIHDHPAFPEYAIALLGLKWDSSLMMSGGLASDLQTYDDDPVPAPRPISADDCSKEPTLVQYLEPDNVEWPSVPTYLFQRNSTGGIYCSNSNSDIVSFSANEKRFVRIGAIDDFLRYCLMCVMQKRDWGFSYRDGFRVGEYNLIHCADAGID